MLKVQIKKRLANFTLQVEFAMENEIVAIFGPSGSGKTTILHAIAGLTKLDDGEISLNHTLFVLGGNSLIPVQKRNIGYLFQDYALFPHKTVWENISYGMKRKSFTESLAEKLNMTHLFHCYPHEISGGEKQRTALIRALAMEPKLLLLDEPFSALDEKTKKSSYEELISLHQEWTIPIILVTHNKEEVQRLANRVLYLQDGKIR